MIEVKKAGVYKMRNNEKCEVYGFDDLGTGKMFAEGYALKDKRMKHWCSETGRLEKYSKEIGMQNEFDIVEFIK